MKKQDKDRGQEGREGQEGQEGQEGFTLLEVVVSTALLLIAATGFLMMASANAGLLAKEHRVDQSNYRIGAMAEQGKGEATGESLAVEFSMEDNSAWGKTGAREVFYQYIVRDLEDQQDGGADGQGGAISNYIVVYRHK